MARVLKQCDWAESACFQLVCRQTGTRTSGESRMGKFKHFIARKRISTAAGYSRGRWFPVYVRTGCASCISRSTRDVEDYWRGATTVSRWSPGSWAVSLPKLTACVVGRISREVVVVRGMRACLTEKKVSGFVFLEMHSSGCVDSSSSLGLPDWARSSE